MKTIYDLEEIITHAKNNSPFYKELYKDIQINKLTDLPIIDQSKFWEANTFQNNTLLAGDINDGIIFKSGGTTGNPKFSFYTKSEWETFTNLFGEGMDHTCFDEGDRVANLFYAGELYASFIFIMKSIEYAKTPVVHLPIAGATPIPDMIKSIKEFEVTTLCGVPTTFLNLASYLKENPTQLNVTKLLYGGEALFDDQREILEIAFPNAEIQSVGYASVDGGHLGYVDKTCKAKEHRVFEGSIMEILDTDTSEVITEFNRPGKLVFTNLTRKFMPIIRYPVGDVAMWTDKNKFSLMGRSDEGARIGPVTINRDDIVSILKQSKFKNNFENFQMVIEHKNSLDDLKLIIAVPKSDTTNSNISNEVTELFYRERPMFKSAQKDNIVGGFEVELTTEDNLIINERTGKLRLLIDNRTF